MTDSPTSELPAGETLVTSDTSGRWTALHRDTGVRVEGSTFDEALERLNVAIAVRKAEDAP